MLRVAPVQLASMPCDAVGWTCGAVGGVYLNVRLPMVGTWLTICWACELSSVWPLMARSIVQLAAPVTLSPLADVVAVAVKPRTKNWLAGTPGMAKPLPWFSTVEVNDPSLFRLTDDFDDRLLPAISPMLGFSVM